MGSTTIKMARHIPPALITNVNIGGFGKFTCRAFYYGRLFWIKIQRLHWTCTRHPTRIIGGKASQLAKNRHFTRRPLLIRDEAPLDVLHERIGNLHPVIIGNPRSGALYVLHQSIQIITRIGDADYADGGAIPYVARIQLRDGNVEAGAQPVFQAANHLPFIFERLCGFDLEFEGEEGDHDSRQLSAISPPPFAES